MNEKHFKHKIVFAILVIIVLAGCTSGSPTVSPTPVATKTAVPMLSFTPAPPTLTPTLWITPEITATPLNLVLSIQGEIDSLIEQLHPGLCLLPNLAIETPPPVDVPSPYELEFTQIETPPNPNSHYVSEIAINIDHSREAFIACEPEHCVDNVYVKDNETGEVYEVNFGAMPWRPLQWLIWVNEDTFIVAQSSNPHYGLFVAINFTRQEYEYFGMAYECLQVTPTP